MALACNDTFQKLACIAEDTSEDEEETKHAESASSHLELAPAKVGRSDIAVRDVELGGWSRSEEEDDSGPTLEERVATIRAPSILVSKGGAEESAVSATNYSWVTCHAQSVSSLTGSFRHEDVMPKAGMMALALARRQPTTKTRAAECFF